MGGSSPVGPSSRVKNNKVKNKRREVGEKNAAKAKKSLDPEQDMVTVQNLKYCTSEN